METAGSAAVLLLPCRLYCLYVMSMLGK